MATTDEETLAVRLRCQGCELEFQGLFEDAATCPRCGSIGGHTVIGLE